MKPRAGTKRKASANGAASTAAAPRVDAHQHFWRLARGDYRWLTPAAGALHRDFEPADLVPELQREHIGRTVLVQAADTVAETRYLLDLAREHAFVAGVVGWVDFESKHAGAEIDELARSPVLVGLRPMLQDLPDDKWMLKRELTDAFRALSARRLAFDALVRPQHLPHLLKLVARHPELDLVVDHLAKPVIRAGGARWEGFPAWSRHLRALASGSRACVKISGLVTEAEPGWTVDDLRPYVDLALEAFGPERCFWGSDWPVVTRAASYGDWCRASETLLAGLAPEDRAGVLGANAVRFYRLAETRTVSA